MPFRYLLHAAAAAALFSTPVNLLTAQEHRSRVPHFSVAPTIGFFRAIVGQSSVFPQAEPGTIVGNAQLYPGHGRRDAVGLGGLVKFGTEAVSLQLHFEHRVHKEYINVDDPGAPPTEGAYRYYTTYDGAPLPAAFAAAGRIRLRLVRTNLFSLSAFGGASRLLERDKTAGLAGLDVRHSTRAGTWFVEGEIQRYGIAFAADDYVFVNAQVVAAHRTDYQRKVVSGALRLGYFPGHP